MNIIQALEARWKGRKAVDALTIAPAVQNATDAQEPITPAIPAEPEPAPPVETDS